jgi:hypothetical protein
VCLGVCVCVCGSGVGCVCIKGGCDRWGFEKGVEGAAAHDDAPEALAVARPGPAAGPRILARRRPVLGCIRPAAAVPRNWATGQLPADRFQCMAAAVAPPGRRQLTPSESASLVLINTMPGWQPAATVWSRRSRPASGPAGHPFLVSTRALLDRSYHLGPTSTAGPHTPRHRSLSMAESIQVDPSRSQTSSASPSLPGRRAYETAVRHGLERER